ncbi:MAG TPA: ABC transporter permease [Thermoanaerobaculaceae bacterium]|nr:ABC transporter permease [Thermoanaerobaculaceae bacterium]
MNEHRLDPIAPHGAKRPHPLVELTRARLLEFLREPEAVFWVFVFPVLLALALGIAFRSKPAETLRAAVERGTPAEARVAAMLRGSPDLTVTVLAAGEADQALRTGKVDVVVAATAAATGSRGEPLSVTYRYDTTRAEGRAARLAVDDALQRALGRPDLLAVHEDRVARPGNRYIDFLIPGLVGLNLMGSGMWGLGFAVVQARVRKLLKRFAATPMRRSHYLLSFMLSRLIGLVLEVAVVVGFGWLLFGVAVRGSLLDLAVVSLLGALTFAGLGLLVAARSRTIEGVSGWMNLVQLPMWLFSGTFFSYERFPAVAQPAIRALPLTALNDALRAVINEGAGLPACWVALAVMALWGGISFAVALRLFRWQ